MPARNKILATLCGVLALAPVTGAKAYEPHSVLREDMVPVFEVRFFEPDDGAFWFGDGTPPISSTWSLNDDQKANILNAGRYWASVIQPVPGGDAGVLNVGTFDDPGAFGASVTLGRDGQFRAPLQVALQGEPVPASQLPFNTHGIFAMGTMAWTPGVNGWSQIGDDARLNMTAVAVHEFAHTLGVSTGSFYSSPTEPHFSNQFSTWMEHLIDDNGRPGRPGQAILCAGCANTDPDGFDVRKEQGLFVGPHVRDALEGGLPGIPVSMTRTDVLGNVSLDTDTMSHMELKNSLMSHQGYRNYTRLMEVELAAMQDLGYVIDRRDHFGRSIYGSGLDVLNTRGYFARSADGLSYLEGRYNLTPLGVGLHVYGSDNRIRQAADLLTAGPGGVGIRVDGQGNQLTIEPGVRVHAQGINGQGVLFAYGRNHRLAVRGDVRATGEQGVGLRFDFGHNLASGDAVEYRGSYLRSSAGGPLPMLAELEGALADSVDISGAVAGSAAAVFMADNALVGQINILRGADIQGDIVSRYAQRDAQGELRLTAVTFGRRAGADGWATDGADAGFRLAYAGNIIGQDNLALSFEGGMTRLDGHHQVHDVTIRPGAAVSGNALYDLAAGSAFVNQGLFSPGWSLARPQIAADYRQTGTGVLQIAFDASGASNFLGVAGQADLAGSLDFAAEPGWYANGWSAAVQPVRAATVLGNFDRVGPAPGVSPTLAFSATAAGAGLYRLAMVRPANAYAQYGVDANDHGVGQALSRLAASASPASTPLFASLDFSSPDGRDVTAALAQLSPSGYSAAMAASLRRDRLAMDAALRGSQPPAGRVRDMGWTGHAGLFGAAGRQDEQGQQVASRDLVYGAIVGASRWLGAESGAMLGFSLDVSEQTVDLRSRWRGRAKATAAGLGAQWRYQPDAWSGPYAVAAARLAVESGSMARRVDVAGYAARHDSRWTSYPVSARLEGGYRLAFSQAASAGPFLSIDYAHTARPALDESGPQATRLHLESASSRALRSRLGLEADAAWGLANGGRLSARARISWDREWRDGAVRQTAYFASQPAASFESANRLAPRNMLGVHAALDWQRTERMALGLYVGAQAGGGYRALEGQLRARWAF